MNKEEFFNQLRASKLPTVVDFWAPWCVPCRRTKPILDQLGDEFSGRVDFQAINADEHPELMRELKILSIPTLLVVDDNKEMSRIMGAQSPENYKQLFSSLAAGEGAHTLPVSNRDRFFRLGAGGALTIVAWMYAEWWLLPIGLLVMFWGIYDRCPIWQAITARLKKSL
jgi:thioredoxin 1